MNMGGEKYSKFLKPKFQIFQPRISLLYNIRHSISLTTSSSPTAPLPFSLAVVNSLRSNVCYTAFMASLYYTYRQLKAVA